MEFNSVDWKEGLTKLNKFVCLYVCHRAKKTLSARETNGEKFWMLPKVTPRGEHESGIQTPRKPIGWLGTNGNRARRKQAFLGYLDAGKTNLGVQTPRKPIGRPGTNGNRVRGKISSYHLLKAQLKSCSHLSSRSRPEVRVDTNINRTSREWRRRTTSHGLSGHQSLENVSAAQDNFWTCIGCWKRSSIFVSNDLQVKETDVSCSKFERNNRKHWAVDSCSRRTTSNDCDIYEETMISRTGMYPGSL